MSDDDRIGLADDVPAHVVEQLLGKSWGELETLEYAGYLLFPETLHQRQRDGSFKRVDVAIRVPREHEKRQARAEARRMASVDGLDPKLDADLIDDLETICLLWRALRAPSPPHEPLTMDAAELEKTYDRAVLRQAFAKLDALHQLIDPSPSAISEPEMIALVSAIARERSILPLAVYAQDAQTSFIVTMADRLQSLLEPRSSSDSSGDSTPEP